MYLPCPNPDCLAEVELVIDEVDSGDGVWFTSGIAAAVVGEVGPTHLPACAAGCALTVEQVAALEETACWDYLDTGLD